MTAVGEKSGPSIEGGAVETVRSARDGGPWPIFRSADESPRRRAGAWTAYGRYWTKYAVFTGRASRSEFWWVWLGNTILYAFIVIGIPLTVGIQPTYTVSTGFLGPVLSPFAPFANGSGDGAGSPFDSGALTGFVVLAFSVVTFVPTLALSFRRLNDVGAPGFLAFLGLGGSGFSGLLLVVALIPSRKPGGRFDRPVVRLAPSEVSRRPMLLAAAGALVGVCLVAAVFVAVAPGAVPGRIQGSWRLVSSIDDSGHATRLPTRPVTLTLTGKAFSGNDSCNDFAGHVASTIPWRTRDAEWTVRGCDDGDGTARKRLHHDFETLSSGRVQGRDLVLTTSEGASLRFQPTT